jgi:signal transduction histidine kinase
VRHSEIEAGGMISGALLLLAGLVLVLQRLGLFAVNVFFLICLGGLVLALVPLSMILTRPPQPAVLDPGRVPPGRGLVGLAGGVLLCATVAATFTSWRYPLGMVAPPLLFAGVLAFAWRRMSAGTGVAGVAAVAIGAAALAGLLVLGLAAAELLSFGESGGALVLAALVAAVVPIAVSPWAIDMARALGREREARIRSDERAELAAQLHDSVLQTLALIQHHASDRSQVATLARHQERELRNWLFGPPPADRGFAAAVEAAAGEVEQRHGVRIEVAAAGDCPLEPRLAALAAAAREAMTNAAKHAQVDEVAVFVEVGETGAAVFVRDRGGGFDPGAVPPDQHGIARSIIERVHRHGGDVQIRSRPGAGTEVRLAMPATPERSQ